MIGSLLWLLRDASCQAILDGTEKLTRKSLDQIAVDMTAQAPPPRTGAETVTHMLPRDRAELIVAEHAGGKSIREIAEAYGHSITTIRDLRPRAAHPGRTRGPGRRLRARSSPTAGGGLPTTRTCGRPPCSPSFPSWASTASRATFYRALERHGIQTHPCPDCHPASMSGYSPPSPGRSPQPFPLPVPAAPVAGETLASFLGRLAAVNRTSPDALLDILPHWFRVKARWHDDRWQPARLIPWADDAAARLAVISGSTTAAIKAALPAFGGKRGQPRPGRHRMPPLHRSPRHPAAGPGPPSRSPAGLHQARHLASRAGNTAVQRQGLPRHPGCRTPGTPAPPPCTIEQLVYSTIQKPGEAGEQSWKHRTTALIESNPRSAAESSPQELFLAAAYPDAIAAAQARSKRFREQSSLTETILADH